jgi:polysaccharide export outer membrane protein
VKIVCLALLVLLLIAVGCGGSKPEPEVDPTVGAGKETETEEEDIWFPEPQPYTMTVGDLLAVKFFYYPQYNVNVTVRPDGFITVPVVGDIRADGVRPADLAEAIRASYTDVLTEPEVSVIVTESANQRYFIFGEVNGPGAYLLGGRMTLLDAIAQAGGVKTSGRTDNIILMRKTETGEYVARRIDIDAKVRTGDTQLTYLVATDVIYVPMSAISKLNVFVDQFFNRLSPAWRFYILARETVNPQGGTIIGR